MVALSHNHWFGRRELIELGWELRDPDMIDFHASALDSDNQREFRRCKTRSLVAAVRSHGLCVENGPPISPTKLRALRASRR